MSHWTHEAGLRLFGSGGERNWIVTTAIGGNYFSQWEGQTASTWVDYARRFGLGIAVFTSDIHRRDEPPRHGAWQKLLAPTVLQSVLDRDFRCLLVDTDVLISPQAKNAFEEVAPGNIGVVSQQNNLPMGYLELRRRIAYLRRTFLDTTFPLDSGLVALPQDFFRLAELEVREDFFCSGVVLLDSSCHADLFAEWYRTAPSDEAYARADWGEQLWLNYCVQGRSDLQWLDYSWQALWLYEVATYYPFLYSRSAEPEIAQWCLASSLLRNNFVHLAGRWEQELLGEWQPEFPGVGSFNEIAVMLERHQKTILGGTLQGVIVPLDARRKT